MSQSGVTERKEELQSLRKDVENTKRRLDSLRKEQRTTQARLESQTKRLTSGQKSIAVVNNQIVKLTSDVTYLDSLILTQEENLERMQRRFLGNIRSLYVTTRAPKMALLSIPQLHLQKQRQSLYLKALAEHESQMLATAGSDLIDAESRRSELSQKHSQMLTTKKRHETQIARSRASMEKQKANLEVIREKSLHESDRLMTLQQAAEEMERIIATLEASQKKKKKEPEFAEPSILTTLKGSLRAPVRGKVVLRYGNHVDPVTKLKTFSPGITISCKPGDHVNSVSGGRVVYAGNLRGYGRFVIISHDGQYFTTYAGLESVAVTAEQQVGPGTTLGVASGEGVVKFELRKGREPVNPLEWLDDESF